MSKLPNAPQSTSRNKTKKSPAVQCGKCDVNLKPKDKAVQCSTCNTQFHTTCQDVSDSLFDFLTSDDCNGVFWFCNICSITTRGMIQKMSNMELRLQAIEVERSKDHNEVKTLKNLVQSLQETCKILERNVKQLSEEKILMAENQEKTVETISGLRRDLYKEHDKNLNLQARIDGLDQKQREKNVRIVGFPEVEENSSNLKSDLIRLVGESGLTVDSIESTTRMGRIRDNKPRDLVVKFSTKESRDKFYALRKKTPKDEDNKKVYINEDLTEDRAKLFFDARRMVKKERLFGTWSQNGNIMVKVKSDDSPMTIQNHQDLASLTRYVYEASEDEMSIDNDTFGYQSGMSD